MKKILLILLTIAACHTFTSCGDDDWGGGEPAMEHVYYIGFEDWGGWTNDVVFNVKQGEMLTIPIQFHSERVRSYNVVTYYYVSGTLIRGTDYQITDEAGNILQPDANGAFTTDWPQAIKGVKNIYVKALNASVGSFTVHTFDPNDKISYTNTTNSITKDYEVRSFTQNYKVTVNIKK
ncbi:hypothetical protein CLV62_11678 [Dysgonomonas alginatilytica]|uniref:Uncharacterized protein n=1 Tax=Dysgonomonas alginatilytica TaxID=1605892 RepID=A0A2V3PM22_9BACT|nr:hypothetical protein [Dysgonomonas alginatilytica]PXV63037.1 hypothetical protein CLV62_11678 [Dysgonomonas alginatilytica]